MIKLKKTKTCNNCRANSRRCLLGYPREEYYYYKKGIKFWALRPVEKCPKPLTYKEFYNSDFYIKKAREK